MSDENQITAEQIQSLPDWAQTHIQALRSEAADWRTKLRTAETDRDANATRIAELEQSSTENGSRADALERDLESERFARTRDRLIRERGLPDSVADVVRGDDEESLIASLDALAALRGTAASEPVPPAQQPDPAQAAGTALDPASAKQAQAEEFFATLD